MPASARLDVAETAHVNHSDDAGSIDGDERRKGVDTESLSHVTGGVECDANASVLPRRVVLSHNVH